MRRLLIIILVIAVLVAVLVAVLWHPKPVTQEGQALSSLPEGYAVLFVTPDSGTQVISTILSWANKSILIMSYEFYHPTFFSILEEKKKGGVDIKVLLENATYGDSGNEWNRATAHLLNKSGIPVRFDSYAGYLHAKVIIVDGSIVIISSENFLPSSFPIHPGRLYFSPYKDGSRGWGIAIRNSTMASVLTDLFYRLYNSGIPYVPGSSAERAPPYYGEMEAPSSFGYKVVDLRGSRVSLLNCSEAYDAIKFATTFSFKRIFAELMYIDLANPKIEDLAKQMLDAAGKGVDVRLLIEDDLPYYTYYKQVQQFFENSSVVVRRAFYNESILFLHNKGIIVDDTAIIGSHNWSYQAFFENIEVSLLVQNKEVVEYFAQVFQWDFERSL